MHYLPVCLNIINKKIVIVGGGAVALQKLKILRQYTRAITIVGEKLCDEIKRSGFPHKEKKYAPEDLRGCFLVYACTNKKTVNARIRRDARRRGLLVNVVDTPRSCDFVSPAIYKAGPMSVAVSSNGQNVKKAIAWRDRVKKIIENDKAFQ